MWLTWDEMVNGIAECPYKEWPDRSLGMIFQKSIVLVGIMTIWRILFTKLVTPLSHQYVIRKTGIDPKHYKKPQIDNVDANNLTDIETVFINIHKSNTINIKSDNNNDDKNDNKSKKNNKKHIDITTKAQKYGISDQDIQKLSHYYKNQALIDKLMYKFCEELWKLVTMGFVTFFGIYALYDKPFVYNSRYLFNDKMALAESFPFEFEIYYYISISYHGHRLIWQYFDHVRTDWLAKLIHHWVTICLIIGSYIYGFTEAGTFVMLLHDNTDFLMSVAKILEWTNIGGKNTAAIGYVIFSISWFGGRIGIFMFKIIQPCFQLWFICYYIYTKEFISFFSLLFCLWLLHCYWGVLLVKALYNLIVKGKVHDPRSDEEKAQSKQK